LRRTRRDQNPEVKVVSDVEATEAIPEPELIATNGVKPSRSRLKSPKHARVRRRKRWSTKLKAASDGKADGRAGAKRPFPASTFEEALELPTAIQTHSPGQPIRRLTLFNELDKAPESGPSRQLITNAHRYGLTKGSYTSAHLELTPEGAIATNSEASPAELLRSRFKLAIEDQPPFKGLYERFKGNKMPSHSVLRDAVADLGIDSDLQQECVDTFILNAKFLGLLKPISGTERLLSLEHVLEELPRTPPATADSPEIRAVTRPGAPAAASTDDWSRICFYITPIGEEDSEERRHSDLFLGSVVEPAIADLGLTLVRADKIGKPGMITRQTLEHVVRSRLVIADLSFRNPNVFYELSLRHACRLPTVQIIRSADGIPFDVDGFRTVRIDTSSIYTLLPSLETYRSEIASHCRRALQGGEAADNPLSVFFPGLKVTIPV
jgi:hypothetical protein